MKFVESSLKQLLDQPIIIRIIRSLMAYQNVLSSAELADQLSKETKEITPLLENLQNLNVIYTSKNSNWLYQTKSPSDAAVKQAVNQYELNFVKQRAETQNLNAAKKLQTIEELAGIISNARKDYRS